MGHQFDLIRINAFCETDIHNFVTPQVDYFSCARNRFSVRAGRVGSEVAAVAAVAAACRQLGGNSPALAWRNKLK